MTPLQPEEHLDRLLDDLLEDHPQLAVADTATIATLEQMVHAASSPAPDPVFVQRLGESMHGLSNDAVRPPSLDHSPRSGQRQFSDHVQGPLSRTAAERGMDQHTTQTAGSPASLPTHQERSQDEGITPRRARAILRSVLPVLTAAAVILLLLTSYLSLVSPQRATPPQQLVAVHEPGIAAPVRLRISVAGIDADILAQAPGPLAPQGSILNTGWLDDAAHTMMDDENATDSFSWLQGSAAPGEHSNVVLQWDGNPAETDPERFQAVRGLRAGDRIEVTTEDDTIMAYRVAMVRKIPAVSEGSGPEDIIGPTPRESLTLVAGIDTLSAETEELAQALMVRAEFAGATPPWRVIRPDAALCPVATRTIPELEEIAGRLGTEPAPRAPLVNAGAEVVSTAKLQLMTATLESLVACFNANEPLRAYALYTDVGVEQMMREWYGDWASPQFQFVPDFSNLATPAVARPDSNRFAILAMEDVRVMPDGRFAARVTISTGEDSGIPGEYGVIGIFTGYPVTYVFNPYADMRIDDFVEE